MDTLLSAARPPLSPRGTDCQIIAAVNDPLPSAVPGVRELQLGMDHRFFDHAAPHADE
ncbi:hypothetical protein ACFWY6_31700 [Streptomyces sp. NPDC059037]|uniref:hypothetical protein n=1 Tax=Streptomyces sp. NPDC059037 TaxID=3346710 RepID=UPI00368127EE